MVKSICVGIIRLVKYKPNRRRLYSLIITNLFVIGFVLLWNSAQQRSTIHLAIAKGKQMLDMPAEMAGYPPGYVLNITDTARVMAAVSEIQSKLGGSDTVFLSAVPLSEGEARYWQDDGCNSLNCAFVTLYNYTDEGTIEAVVNLVNGEVLGQWANVNGRPAGSSEILPKAMSIASSDSQVIAILGEDIGAMDPALIPMSAWLSDNDCRQDWCVDVAFHDPSGTGRVYHVIVNLEQEKVARTFYTRAREDRSLGKPLDQRSAFTDGCHEQYGWSVCWEMTANDGVNFRDATYNDRLIFSSAKIGQVEAWYPSWPGGYRDEIGFAASVPPFGDTQINDLGDGFEIRQMFTEFTRWPNCICCYRYEEVIQYKEDGRLELKFVSHGPGCDDVSVYRPFWRIDVDLDGPDNDQVWLFDGTQWVEETKEFETYPLVKDLSPEGHKLATFDNDLHYRWSMERTDPLGLDEGYLFLLKWNENEGEGPITTGPGDMFVPPRQWLDSDPLSGQNIVLWHVPLLNTKKGGPWWCQPDPEPDFSPCESILHADPSGELRQPTAEEIAEQQAQIENEPTTEATAIPSQPSATPRPIGGVTAEEIILNAGCGNCHKIGDIGEAHKVGPDLSYIGLTAEDRVPDMSAEDYIKQSILEPNAYLAPECPNTSCLPNIMPQNFSMRLTDSQMETLVAFLMDQQGVSPAPPTIGSDTPGMGATKAVGLSKVATPAPQGSMLVSTTVGVTLIIMMLILSAVLVAKGFLVSRKD